MAEEKKNKRVPLSPDKFEILVEPLKLAVDDVWNEAWRDPNAEDYKLVKMANLTLIASSFINYYFTKSEGAFGMIRYVTQPPEIENGITLTSFGGAEGIVKGELTIPTFGESASNLEVKEKLYNSLRKILPEVQQKGLEIFKWYAKHPQEKVPQVYEKAPKEYSEKKYFVLEKNPWEYTQTLMRIPESMYTLWAKRLGPESIKDAGIQLNYSNEFSICINRTRDASINNVEKEIRLTLEAMVDVKNVGQVGEAIGSAGGIDSLKFTHPLTFKVYNDWDAIEAIGNWVGDKAQMLQRAEKPEDVFEDKKINVVMPSTLIGAAISYFISGKKMWESIKNEKTFQLYKLLGQKIVPDEWSMILDGRQETAWGDDLYGSLESDAEGTLAGEKKIIESGKLKRFYNSRVYFLPIAERSALAKELLEEENPLTATARKESAKNLIDTIPTNLYIKSSTDTDLESLINMLGKQKTHLYALSSSFAGVDLNTGKIKIKVDLGQPIQAGKINKDISIGKLSFDIDFNTLSEKLKYTAGKKTDVSHAFNLEVDGNVYAVSVTGPYVALFDVEYRSTYGYEKDGIFGDIFTSDRFYTDALPRYLGSKRKYLRTGEAVPESLKGHGIVSQPFAPTEIMRRTLEARKHSKI